MTNIYLKNRPVIAANILPQALKGRPDVKHGCNPCAKTQQVNHVCNPCIAKTLLLALLLALLTPGAANAQNRAIVTIGEGTSTQPYPLPGTRGINTMSSSTRLLLLQL